MCKGLLLAIIMFVCSVVKMAILLQLAQWSSPSMLSLYDVNRDCDGKFNKHPEMKIKVPLETEHNVGTLAGCVLFCMRTRVCSSFAYSVQASECQVGADAFYRHETTVSGSGWDLYTRQYGRN